jgi:hypothetical protein
MQKLLFQGLGQDVVHPVFQQPLTVAGQGVRGHRDNGNPGQPLLLVRRGSWIVASIPSMPGIEMSVKTMSGGASL